jgi:hypothetical protein
MSKMTRFMVVHRDPDIGWEQVESKWKALANVDSAIWERTWYNMDKGVRYCLWRSPDQKTLKGVFKSLGVRWTSILEVQETVPDVWAMDADEVFLGPT